MRADVEQVPAGPEHPDVPPFTTHTHFPSPYATGSSRDADHLLVAGVLTGVHSSPFAFVAAIMAIYWPVSRNARLPGGRCIVPITEPNITQSPFPYATDTSLALVAFLAPVGIAILLSTHAFPSWLVMTAATCALPAVARPTATQSPPPYASL